MSSTKAKSKAAAPEVTVDGESTAPAPRCLLTGRPLDQWGLPLNGPARVAALAELGLPDPNDDPVAWAHVLPVDTSMLASTLPVQGDHFDMPGIGPITLPAVETQSGDEE